MTFKSFLNGVLTDLGYGGPGSMAPPTAGSFPAQTFGSDPLGIVGSIAPQIGNVAPPTAVQTGSVHGDPILHYAAAQSIASQAILSQSIGSTPGKPLTLPAQAGSSATGGAIPGGGGVPNSDPPLWKSIGSNPQPAGVTIGPGSSVHPVNDAPPGSIGIAALGSGFSGVPMFLPPSMGGMGL
jgi:hypothetical protein